MKKFTLFFLIYFSLLGFAQGSNEVQKIMQCYSSINQFFPDELIKFEAKEVENGYDVYIKPADKNIKQSDVIKFHFNIDEGPIITSPYFTFGKVGLVSQGSLLDVFANVKDKYKKQFDKIKYSYKATVSFGNEAKTQFTLGSIDTDNFHSSKININNQFDIDNCKGTFYTKIDSLKLKIKNDIQEYNNFIINYENNKNKKLDIRLDSLKVISNDLFVTLKNLFINYERDNKLVDGYHIFGKLNFGMNVETTEPGKLTIPANININSAIKPVSDNLASAYLDINISSSSQILKEVFGGIDNANIDIELQNFKIKPMVELSKILSKLIEIDFKINRARDKNDFYAMKEALLKKKELLDSLSLITFDLYNDLFVKDKTKIVLNYNVGRSFVKVNLLCKADKIYVNQFNNKLSFLRNVDGYIEMQMDEKLVYFIIPDLFIRLVKMEQKGIVDKKNGMFILKLNFKNGNVIIKGKSYKI